MFRSTVERRPCSRLPLSPLSSPSTCLANRLLPPTSMMPPPSARRELRRDILSTHSGENPSWDAPCLFACQHLSVIGVFSDVKEARVMEDLSSRTAQEVLDDHLNLAENWGGEGGFERGLEVDLERNTSKDIVILINRGTFRGHEGVRQLARMLGEELPEQRSFEYTYKAVEGKMAFLEWAYEDANVMVRDGADSFLIEDGKIVAQTIHYTVEQKPRSV